MHTTQQHLSISDIQNDILLLKDGGGALVLKVSAVNFGLLSEREQTAIIGSFAQMLNSLSFSIQVVLYSERLNINSYLEVLDKARQAQTNPLLSKMIAEYKQFIQSVVKDMEVLDKNFYLVIPLFNLELGLITSKQALEQKIKTVLLPRRDQVIRQLNRVGLEAVQLQKTELVKIFYGIYNGAIIEKPENQAVKPQDLVVRLKNPNPTPIPAPAPIQPTAPPIQQPVSAQNARNHPFVVEELEE
ncbi:hypothetical protein A3J19_03815 [Candidatus Daviesbacteria bacterium RIFCSPLOWO2_02_FULL_41_8]|uniref:Uncharacterized protein n=3 Tax=Candidatus Daviesiibacteriota TaxID=1752718 RepID=A0A1F5NLD1_9BACT|nr:MAG: hypothetical protein A2871_04165 [Candidatus Daviesbacteria bacterium RIFCSPHIGHO2_01_FULL_41_23]OGE32392.1 MAG: hypothetical protein A3D83_01965 [Candidatus Daviesbacteria bacterium RIFCSPHIGHO2_02_FULL_41_10]OGE62265.1 MAG: hypothetical protein A2967_02305 [Candidatus Daviesbacteria bacterium RIFCSPLOWO2_01_FULL_41_32]OGE78363.1 MAG: hypothetical protein A3J19_03815 [Candidatus Daviesbacteria bacterium RIFCSPLOWO2_02_FULL_41_8]